MQGLELSFRYFEEYGRPMLSEFPDIAPYVAVGLVGSGSERFGFDDDVSVDHDLEPGFCIFLPGEDVVDRKAAFALERAYSKLPKEYEGFKRQLVSPVGGSRLGVIRTADFYTEKVGAPDGNLTKEQWLTVPDYALAEATNGEVFLDNYGEFTRIRKSLLNMPEDIRKKRLAGNLLIMAQSGQYNFARCIKHGEPEAAQLAANEFVNAALKVIFLLNKQYLPYYKWSFKALRNLGTADDLAIELGKILCGDNKDSKLAEDKYFTIEGVATKVILALQNQGLTKASCGDLEKHAYSVNDEIEDNEIRNMHVMAAI